MTDPETVIGGRGLTKRYGSTTALQDVTFQLRPGTVTALVGANGAGKSTFLEILAGHLAPSRGSITLGQGLHGRPKVTLLEQDKPVYENFKVTEILEFGRRTNRHWDQGIAREWLEAFNIPLARRCGKLSGGQRTQVALSLALGAAPDVLLLDEPLANLDPLVREEVTRRLLRIVQDLQMTVVLSTHVVAEIRGAADSLIVLRGGRVVLDGEIDDLLEAHSWLVGPGNTPAPSNADVVAAVTGDRENRYLIRRSPGRPALHPQWAESNVTLDQLVLAHLRQQEDVPSFTDRSVA